MYGKNPGVKNFGNEGEGVKFYVAPPKCVLPLKCTPKFRDLAPSLSVHLEFLKKVKSDNGPPFSSKKFEAYAEKQKFKIHRVTPAGPEANGDVERFMQKVKKRARIAKMEGTNVEKLIQKTI